jgi:hypothetical protein
MSCSSANLEGVAVDNHGRHWSMATDGFPLDSALARKLGACLRFLGPPRGRGVGGRKGSISPNVRGRMRVKDVEKGPPADGSRSMRLNDP